MIEPPETSPATKPDQTPVEPPPLASLPVFYKLTGRRCVVVGGSDGAAWKAELLLSAGAVVDVYAAEPCERLVRLVESEARARLHRRDWANDDLNGALIAIADAETDAEAENFVRAARAYRAALQPGRATVSRRAATFTVSPIAVYSIRRSLPRFPTTAGPVLTPMPR